MSTSSDRSFANKVRRNINWLLIVAFCIFATVIITLHHADDGRRRNLPHLIQAAHAAESIPIKHHSKDNYYDNNIGDLWNDPFFSDPFFNFDLYRRHIDQMFKSMNQRTESNHFNPRLSVEQTSATYIVSVDLPGINKESIDIELVEDSLYISGERRIEREETNDSGYYRSESSFGKFSRSISLPEDAIAADIKAKYNNGVLKIEIPRDPSITKDKARKIPVT